MSMKTVAVALSAILLSLAASHADAAPAKRKKRAVAADATTDPNAPPPPGYGPPAYGPPAYGQPAYRQPAPGAPSVWTAPRSPSIFGLPEQHDGFYLRLLAGTNLSTVSKIDGSFVGLALDAAVGYSVIDNLPVFGELRLTNNVRAFGAGTVYYLMPINIYLGGSLLLAQGVVADSFATYTSNFGPALSLQAGKEWWVGDQLGLGVAAQLLMGAVTFDELFDSDKTLVTFALTASLTWN